MTQYTKIETQTLKIHEIENCASVFSFVPYCLCEKLNIYLMTCKINYHAFNVDDLSNESANFFHRDIVTTKITLK